MRILQNAIGKKFNRLLVLGTEEYIKKYSPYFPCRCDCGTIKKIPAYDVIRGHIKSCGCLQKEQYKNGKSKTHGMSRSPFYSSWRCMINRCTNPNNEEYHNYGKRGIMICEQWRKFENFYSDMFPIYKKGLYLERIDNSKGYYPENCTWATPKEQANNRRSNRILEFNGQHKNIRQWSDDTGIKFSTIIARLRYGWTTKHTLTAPVRQRIEK